MRTNASGIFLLCTCLCLWWPDNTNRGRPMVGRHPHMSPMLTGLAEYPVVINVLLLSIPRSLSGQPGSAHRDPTRRSRFTSDSGSGLSGVRGRPGSVWSQPSDHQSVSQSVRVTQTRRTSLVTAETPLALIIITLTSGTEDWMSLSLSQTSMHIIAQGLKHFVSPMLKLLFHPLMQELCRANKQVKNGYL